MQEIHPLWSFDHLLHEQCLFIFERQEKRRVYMWMREFINEIPQWNTFVILRRTSNCKIFQSTILRENDLTKQANITHKASLIVVQNMTVEEVEILRKQETEYLAIEGFLCGGEYDMCNSKVIHVWGYRIIG